MKFVLTIDCANAAFQPTPNHEVSRILSETAGRIIRGEIGWAFSNLRDVNGNIVGVAAFKDEVKLVTE